ncbi:MAG: cell wall anchor protein [Duncaniella sp.]|nr:cell wall anchor protein [Duncaniella sp.]
MNRINRYIRTAAVGAAMIAAAGTCSAAPQSNVKVTASIDSSMVLMGKRSVITIATTLPSKLAGGAELLLPSDTLVKNVEIVGVNLTDSIGRGDLVELRHQLVIQSFDSGMYALPPLRMRVGNDTALSNHLVMKVIPVPVDTLQGKIHDYAGVADPGRHFLDFIPQKLYYWTMWLLLALVVAGMAYYGYYRFYRRPKKRAKEIVVIPPYDESVSALDNLKSRSLCEKGHEKEFYTRLTDILRVYLHGRFGINAMEMTSTQIRHMLNSNAEAKLSKENMERVLETADFVKFAKVRPLPDDNIRAFNSAMQFVEDTKPKTEPEETPEGENETETTTQNHK